MKLDNPSAESMAVITKYGTKGHSGVRGQHNFSSFLHPQPTTWGHFKNNVKTLAAMPLSTLQDKYRKSREYLKQFNRTRYINPLHTSMYMLGLKEDTTMSVYCTILKGKGPKGHSWKLVNGKRVYSGGDAAVATPNAATSQSTQSAFPAQTFHQVGEHFGGVKYTDNVMTHKDKALADNHEGFIHGHLTDSGYTLANQHTENGIHTSHYKHPDGGEVMLHNGISGGKNFVGYNHTPAPAHITSTASNMVHGTTAKKPDAHKVVQAYGDQKGYSPEILKGGTSVHTLRSNDMDDAVAVAQNFHHHITGQGFEHKGTTAHNGLNVTVSNYKHPNGAVSQSVVTPNGHSFSVTPPKSNETTTTSVKPSGSSSLKAKDLTKLANLTDENFHGEAIAHGSKMLGRDDLHAEAKQINREHISAGGLTQDLMDRRHAVYTKMMNHAKETLSPSDYTKFHGSF